MGWETTDLFHWHRPETNTKWPPNSISQTPSQDPWWKIEHRLHAPGDGLDGLSQDVAADSQSQTQVPQDMGTGCANGIMVKDTNHASGLGQPHHGPRRGTFVDVRWIPVEPQDHLHRPHDFQGHGCWSQLQVLEVNDCQGRAYTLDAAPTSYDARALFCRTGGFGQTSIGISQSHRATVWEAWTNSDKRQGFMDLAGPTRLQRHLCQPQPPGRKHFRRCQRDAGLVAWERANALHNKQQEAWQATLDQDHLTIYQHAIGRLEAIFQDPLHYVYQGTTPPRQADQAIQKATHQHAQTALAS